MALLDDIKIILGIISTDTSKDDLLNLYIRKGTTLITNYLKIPITGPPLDITITYPDALLEYVTSSLSKKGSEGVKNYSQGSKSVTYDTNGLSDSIKTLLPLPSIRMRG